MKTAILEIQSALVLWDQPIREAWKSKRLNRPWGWNDYAVIEELPLDQGGSKVDIVSVGAYSFIHGFELKSDGDTLKRLPRQVHYYNKALDKITLIVGYSHVYEAMYMIPSWWGVEVVERNNNEVIEFSTVRLAKVNPMIDPHSVAKLLDRSEVLNIFHQLGTSRGKDKQPNSLLYTSLVDALEVQDLKRRVRQSLIARTSLSIAALLS